MSEFRVASHDASDRGRERNIRLVTWGLVLVMAGITFFAVYDARSASPQLGRALTWLAVLIVVCAIAGCTFALGQIGDAKALPALKQLAERVGSQSYEKHSLRAEVLDAIAEISQRVVPNGNR